MDALPLIALDEAAAALRAALAAVEQSRKALMLAGSNVRPAPMLDLSKTVTVPVAGKLVDRPKRHGRIQAVIDPELWAFFTSDYLRPAMPGIASCYERVSALAAERGLEIPSAETFRRRLIAEGLHGRSLPRRNGRFTEHSNAAKTGVGLKDDNQPEERGGGASDGGAGTARPHQSGCQSRIAHSSGSDRRIHGPTRSSVDAGDGRSSTTAALQPQRQLNSPTPERDDIASRKAVRAPEAFDRQRRKSDALYYDRVTREARELEAPVDRLQLIRRAAEKLRATGSAAARTSFGVPQRGKPAMPVNPIEQRIARVGAAIRFLSGQGVLVSVTDRQAMIRTYRIAGRREGMLAEDVIALAVEKGAQL